VVRTKSSPSNGILTVTLSTVGIASDADTNLLQELAQLGHGRYYDGNDPFDLPQLLVKETQQVQRAAIVEEDFTPLPIASNPATEGIDVRQAPQLRGYVATTAKPQSTVLLASRQLDPVLSEWQYGLGRVMACDVRREEPVGVALAGVAGLRRFWRRCQTHRPTSRGSQPPGDGEDRRRPGADHARRADWRGTARTAVPEFSADPGRAGRSARRAAAGAVASGCTGPL